MNDSNQENEPEIINMLCDFGLDELDAKLYLSMLRLGEGRVSEICRLAEINRVKGYKIIENLKNFGLVESSLSSPTIYNSTDPKKSLDNLLQSEKLRIERLQSINPNLIKKLKEISKQKTKPDLPKLVTISGRENVFNYIKQILDEAKDEVTLVLSANDIIRIYYTDIPNSLKQALKRNITIRLITELDIASKLSYVQRLGLTFFKIVKLPSHGRIAMNESELLISGNTSPTSSFHTDNDTALLTNSLEIFGNIKTLCDNFWHVGQAVKVKETEPTGAISQTENLTAIVIDDEKDSADMLSDYLEIKGIKVSGKADDGKKGFEIYKKLNPDLVFLDILMPEYDGFFAFEQIKNFDPNSRIIFITADLRYSTKKKLRELNPTGVIFKPYDIDKILDQLFQVPKENLKEI